MQTLLAIGLFQTVLSIFLIFDLGRIKINRSPMLLMLIFLAFHFAIKSCLLFIVKDEYMFQYFSTCFNFAYGPLVLDFLYIHYGKKRLSKIHFIPLFIGFAVYLYVGVMTLIYKELIFLEYYKKYIPLLMVLSTACYFGYIFVWLVTNRKFPNSFARWIVPISGLLIIIFIIALFDIIPQEYLRASVYILYIFIGFQYLRYELEVKEKVMQWHNEKNVPQQTKLLIEQEEAIENVAISKKYERSSLSEKQCMENVTRVKRLVEKERLYLDQDFSLSDLAQKVDIPKHHLSESLNLHLQKSFYQFINEYRIQEAIRLIEEDPSQKLLHLAFDCGFNTKATFNTYFKKITGNTPSHFKTEIKGRVI